MEIENKDETKIESKIDLIKTEKTFESNIIRNDDKIIEKNSIENLTNDNEKSEKEISEKNLSNKKEIKSEKEEDDMKSEKVEIKIEEDKIKCEKEEKNSNFLKSTEKKKTVEINNDDFFLTSNKDNKNKYYTPLRKIDKINLDPKIKSLQLEKKKKKKKIKIRKLNKKFLPHIKTKKIHQKKNIRNKIKLTNIKERIQTNQRNYSNKNKFPKKKEKSKRITSNKNINKKLINKNERIERDKFERKHGLNSNKVNELIHERFKKEDEEKEKRIYLERDAILKQRKAHFKPYDYSELNKFSIKCDSRKVLLKKKIIDKIKIQKDENKALIPIYQKYMDDVRNSSLIENSSFVDNEKKAKRLASSKINKNKMSKYAYYVKENFLPIIIAPNPKMKVNLTKINNNIRYIEDIKKDDYKKRKEFRDLGIKYLQKNGKKKLKEKNKVREKENVVYNQKKEIKVRDYLKDLKKKNKGKNSKSLSQRINKIFYTKSSKQEYKKAFNLINNLDDKLNEINKNKEINLTTENYIESIKAKLCILEKIN